MLPGIGRLNKLWISSPIKEIMNNTAICTMILTSFIDYAIPFQRGFVLFSSELRIPPLVISRIEKALLEFLVSVRDDLGSFRD